MTKFEQADYMGDMFAELLLNGEPPLDYEGIAAELVEGQNTPKLLDEKLHKYHNHYFTVMGHSTQVLPAGVFGVRLSEELYDSGDSHDDIISGEALPWSVIARYKDLGSFVTELLALHDADLFEEKKTIEKRGMFQRPEVTLETRLTETGKAHKEMLVAATLRDLTAPEKPAVQDDSDTATKQDEVGVSTSDASPTLGPDMLELQHRLGGE